MLQPIGRIVLSIAAAQVLWAADCGNGDTSSCIQSVIDTCTSGSVTVTIGAGTLDIDENISIPAGCHEVIIDGDGASTSILQLSMSLPEAIKVKNDGSHDLNLTLKEVTLSGDSQTVTKGGIYCYGYQDTHQTKLLLQHAVVSGFVNNTAAFSAGVFAKNGCDVNITGSTLKNNTAGYYGGAIRLYSRHDSLSVESSSVISGNRAKKGGGIYAKDALVKIANSTISGNVATGSNSYGGALYFQRSDASGASSLDISGTSFSGNTAGYYGAGAKIHVNSGFSVSVNISGSTFTDNNTTASNTDRKGGALFSYGANVNISGTSSFLRNYAHDSGGAIFFDNGALKITDTTFQDNNVSANNGGAVYVAGALSSLSINGTTFTSNYSKSGEGGAIYITPPTNFEINSSTLSGNHANGNGGAIATDTGADGSIKMYGNTFTSNYSTSGNGGAVYAYKDNIKIQNCLFSGNTANGTAKMGGALYVKNTGYSVDINRSTFSGNTAAANGGAIWLYHGTGGITVTESNVTGNTATTGVGGGVAIKYSGGSGAVIRRSLFSGNMASASNGGGIYHKENGAGFLEVLNSTFSGNTANSGGAIYSESVGDECRVKSSTFASNTAVTVGEGGAIDGTSNLKIYNNLFSGNTGGGSAKSCGASVTETNSYHNIFDETTPECNSTLISTDAQGDFYVSDFTTVMSTTLTDNGGPTYTYALVSGSPALDAGHTTAVTLSAYDQRGEGYPRNVGTTVDIGAYEYSLNVTALSPTDGESNLFCHEFNCAPMLVMDFSEDINVSTGDIRLIDDTDGSSNLTIPIDGEATFILGTKLYINIKNELDPSTDYHVEIDNGAIVTYGGISDSTTWNFTTESWANSTSGSISTATGYFIDGAVKGLTYICGTKSGTTGSSGEFSYDHECTYWIGDTWFHAPLSDLQATQSSGGYVTPYTIFPDDTEKVTNLACLLQFLDHDDDLSNGILLDDSQLTGLGYLNLGLDTESFISEVNGLLGDAALVDANGVPYDDRNLTSICANAKSNLDASIAALTASGTTSSGGGTSGGGGGGGTDTPATTSLSDVLGDSGVTSTGTISFNISLPSGSEVSGDSEDSTVLTISFELEGTETVSGVSLTVPTGVTDAENGNTQTVVKVTVTDADGNEIGKNEISAPQGSEVKPSGNGIQVTLNFGDGQTAATTNANGEVTVTVQRGDSGSQVYMPAGTKVSIGEGSTTSTTTVQTSFGLVRITVVSHSGTDQNSRTVGNPGTNALFSSNQGSFQSNSPDGSSQVKVNFISYNRYRSFPDDSQKRALASGNFNALRTQFVSDRSFTAFTRYEINDDNNTIRSKTYRDLDEYLMEKDLTEAEEIEIIPGSDCKFEDVVRFDGVRSFRLLSGNANIIVNGLEKRMMPGLIYELPPEISAEDVVEEVEVGNDNATGDALFEDGIFYLNKGWNLITSPVDENLTIPDVTVSWKFQDSAWEKSSATLEPRLGYWLQLPEETELDLGQNGATYQPTYSQLTSGWHLVGTGKNLSYVQNATTVSEVWVYDREGTWSLNPSIIYAGQGFWIKRE